MTTRSDSIASAGLVPCYTLPPEQVEAMLAEHVQQVQPVIDEINRQQITALAQSVTIPVTN